MRTLHIIMPMAGEGSRFKNEGWTLPKPLIPVDDVPAFMKAIDSLSSLYEYHNDVKYTFIVRAEHIADFEIDRVIRYHIPSANIIAVEKTTRGAVETCLLAKPYISENDSILIMDCDLCYDAHWYEDHMLTCLQTSCGYDGLLLSFNSSDPRYSYALTDDDMSVIRTAEKNPISNNALIGSYFFTYSQDFINAAERLIAENDVKDIKEYYVSLLFNYMIVDNKRIKCIPATEYHSFGTPEELKAYENRSDNN